MNDFRRMGMQHWAGGFDSSHLKDCLKDHPAMKLMDMLAERDAAVAERDTAMADKKTAFAERDAALLQRDLANADRNAAWMERDATLAALAMIKVGKENNEATAKLMHMVSGFPPFMWTNGQGVSKVTNLSGTKLEKLTLKKGKLNASEDQTNKDVKLLSKRRRRQKTLKEITGSERISQPDGIVKVSDNFLSLPSSTHPYCSCTGSNQQCYRWGKGGWQSACCTNFFSMYPLPLNPTKRGLRVPGRKMSGGAFGKLLDRLVTEGVDISKPVDLKKYWAKHGTNRYITIK